MTENHARQLVRRCAILCTGGSVIRYDTWVAGAGAAAPIRSGFFPESDSSPLLVWEDDDSRRLAEPRTFFFPSGEMVMATARFTALGLAALLLGVVSQAPADDGDAALRDKILALNNFTGNDPMDGEVKLLVKDAASTKKLLPLAVKMLEGKEPPINYNAAFILGRAAQDLKDFDAAEKLFKFCSDQAVKLESGNKMVQSFGGLIDLYYDNKKYDKAVKLCKEFMDIGGNETVARLKPAVLERMIQALARQGKYDDALKRVDELVKIEEDDKGWWALQLKAWVLREAEKLSDAAKTYELVLDRLHGDKTLKNEQKAKYIERNRYVLSGVYVDLEKIDKAAEQLETLLKDKPDDPTYNNDLGYILADHDMELEKAEKLIRKAIEEDKKKRKASPEYNADDDRDNAAYLDSLGWVLFKKKDYKEAKKYLLEATKDKEDGQHIDIFEHLGDVHKALGEKDLAIAAYKKGIEVAGTSKRELKTKESVEKKLKELQ
jgi:tetratricopeptide (TPR) repeat protein